MTLSVEQPPSTRRRFWRPSASAWGERAAWMAAALLVAALASFATGAAGDPGPGALGLLVLAALLAAGAFVAVTWALGYRGLRYVLGPTALEVWWRGASTRVPYAAVEGIYSGQRLTGVLPPRQQWPGLVIGRAGAAGVGPVECFTTTPNPAEWLVVALPDRAVALSPAATRQFRTALIECVEGAAEVESTTTESMVRGPAVQFPWPAIRDRWLPWSMGATIAALLIGAAAIHLRIDSLPGTLPLRFDAAGEVAEIGARGDLFRLLLVGLAVLVINGALGIWAHTRERLLARLLWTGAGLVAGAVAVALVRLVA